MEVYLKVDRPDTLSAEQLDEYLANGWYRMYQTVFTSTHWRFTDPYDVLRVWGLRYDVNRIIQRSSHKRMYKRNRGFQVSIHPMGEISAEDESLYTMYRASKSHYMSETLFELLMQDENQKQIFHSWCIEVRDDGKLIAKAIFDKGKDAALSEIHMYDPAYARYSLGKYLMLLTIDHLEEQGMKWYYPGYIVVGLPRFDYKLFVGKEWAEYYDPEEKVWKPFDDGIMKPEELTEEDQHKIYDGVFSFWR